jgi:hypothetical protein
MHHHEAFSGGARLMTLVLSVFHGSRDHRQGLYPGRIFCSWIARESRE